MIRVYFLLTSALSIEGLHNNIFKGNKHKYNLSSIDNVSEYFGNNYRKAKMIFNLYYELMDELNNENIRNSLKVTDKFFLDMCKNIIEIEFYFTMSNDNNEDEDIVKPNGEIDYKKLGLLSSKEEFMQNISILDKKTQIRFLNYFKSNRFDQIAMRYLVYCYLFYDKHDLSGFKKEYERKKMNSRKMFFYLSDKAKENEIKELCRDIQKNNDNYIIERIKEVIKYYYEKLDDAKIDLFSDYLSKQYKIKKVERIEDIFYIYFDENKRNDVYKANYDMLINTTNSKINENNIDFFDEFVGCYTNKEYLKLTDFFNYNSNKIKSNERIMDFIMDNNYLIPDLSGNITEQIWRFSHSVARFASEIDKKEEYKKALITKYNKYKEKTKSLTVRCNALVYYNFNTDFSIEKESLSQSYNKR